jgi:hypothetical protein
MLSEAQHQAQQRAQTFFEQRKQLVHLEAARAIRALKDRQP